MELIELHVYHFNKGNTALPITSMQNTPSLGSLKELDPLKKRGCFYFETCQRWIWVTSQKNHELFSPSLQDLPYKIESFSGKAAYLFLLRVATGLESVVIGETDVFGQFKEAWSMFQTQSAAQSDHDLGLQLSPWMQLLFEDTKEIRKTYLQKVGGASYGSLVRKWLKETHKELSLNSILLVGAGKIAQSIAPFLLDFELWLTNRNPERLKYLEGELQQKTSSTPHRPKILEQASEGWRSASCIISCIPFDPQGDLERRTWFSEGATHRPILHLGGLRIDAGEWTQFPHFACLNEVFELQERCHQFRTTQVRQAIQACHECAAMRASSPSPSLTQRSQNLLRFALGG